MLPKKEITTVHCWVLRDSSDLFNDFFSICGCRRWLFSFNIWFCSHSARYEPWNELYWSHVTSLVKPIGHFFSRVSSCYHSKLSSKSLLYFKLLTWIWWTRVRFLLSTINCAGYLQLRNMNIIFISFWWAHTI